MSARAAADHRGAGRKPRIHAGHLWPVPAAVSPAPAADDADSERASTSAVTVSITIDGGDPAGQERLVAALREVVLAAGGSGRVAVARGTTTAVVPAATPGSARGSDSIAAPAVHVVAIEPKPRSVTRDGEPLHLSRLEYDLLLFLAQHPRQVFSRAQLLGQVWGHTHTTLRTVDVHVSRLRSKLDGQELITTVYGLGYRLADDAGVTVAC